MGARGAYGMALKRRGRWFDPALVDAMLGFRDDAAFWGPLEDARAVPPVARWEPRDRMLHADEAQLDNVAEAFGRVIDAKSPFTARHSAGVAAYAVAIAETMGMGADAQRDLRRAGLLHDIGKLAVSSRILDKPGKLTDEEFTAMKAHPAFTLRILERVACFRPLASMAAAHHERLDGSGYHLGLAAFDLSRSARILAVADVFEALTADRPYREAMPIEKALGIVRGMSGTALCPAAVGGPGGVAGRRAGASRLTSLPMKVSVRLFAGLRERAGGQHIEVELPDGALVGDLLAAMASTPVGAIAPGQCVVAINREYAPVSAEVRAEDEIALIPPVSGGAGPVRSVRVTGEPLDVAALSAAVRDPRAGAVVVFEGVTREVPELDYEAYAEMAAEKLRAIGEEEAERHGLCAVALEHRTGTVPAGRAERDRRGLRAPSRRGVRRRPRADRPGQGRGADLEGRGRRGGPPPRRGHAPAAVLIAAARRAPRRAAPPACRRR